MSAEKKWSGLWRLRDPRERFIFQGGSEIATALANTFDRLLEDRDALTAERDALRRYLRHERDKDMSDTIRMEEQCAIYARAIMDRDKELTALRAERDAAVELLEDIRWHIATKTDTEKVSAFLAALAAQEKP